MEKIKPILSLLALFALTLTGCGELTKQERTRMYEDSFKELSYKGHDYLILVRGGETKGITHDPGCPCREKGGEK
jgi:lipoprotein